MITFLDIVIAGLLLGGLYALIAMGLSLQYGVARVLNVSHGEFIMIGGFLTWMLYLGSGVNPLVCLAIVGPLTFVAGWILHSTVFKHLLTGSYALGEITVFVGIIAWTLSKLFEAPVLIILPASIIVIFAMELLMRKYFGQRKVQGVTEPGVFEGKSMLASFGILYIIQNMALLQWGAELRAYSYLSIPVNIGGALFGANRLVTLGFAVAIGVIFYIFLARSRMGKAIRASAQDPSVAGLMGVNINRVLAICFGLGAAMAGIAGVLVSMIYPVHGSMGLGYTVIAIIVVVLGGMGSIPGSFIGGFILGIIESIVTYFEPGLTLAAYYVIFIILLLVRPKGIMGK